MCLIEAGASLGFRRRIRCARAGPLVASCRESSTNCCRNARPVVKRDRSDTCSSTTRRVSRGASGEVHGIGAVQVGHNCVRPGTEVGNIRQQLSGVENLDIVDVSSTSSTASMVSAMWESR